MEKRFCVDNNSDPKYVARTVRHLRRMIRFGKLAEKVLQDLRSNGFYNERVPIIRPNLGYSESKPEYYVDTHRFPVYEPICQDDIPNWDNLSVECGEMTEGKHGGVKFKQMPVYLRGTALEHNPDHVRSRHQNWQSPILRRTMKSNNEANMLGFCRFKSNGEISFNFNNKYGAGTIRVKRSTNASDKIREETLDFARIVARCLIRYETSNLRANGRNVPQKMLDLRAIVPQWLIEDGTVQRMFSDMLDMSNIVKVQNI